MAGIFVSYRRVEGEWANRLSRHLGNRFGNDLVFQDVDDIAGGEKWHNKIAQAMASAEVTLVMIGPHWLVDQAGHRRLDDAADVLRSEVAEALRLNKVILPVLVGGATMPDRKELPEDIAPLTDINALNLRDSDWNDDISRLLERVRDILRPTREREQLYNVQLEAYRLQEQFFKVLEQDREPAGALDVARQALALLDRVTPLYPADIILLASRGYTHKNLAIALRRLERHEEGDEHLAMADQVFTTLRDEFPMEPAAWDGKGSVEFMRGNLEEARRCFERALKMNPTYDDAIQNLDTVLAELEKRGGS